MSLYHRVSIDKTSIDIHCTLVMDDMNPFHPDYLCRLRDIL